MQHQKLGPSYWGIRGTARLNALEESSGQILPRPQPWRGADVMNGPCRWILRSKVLNTVESALLSSQPTLLRIFVKRPVCLMLRHFVQVLMVLKELLAQQLNEPFYRD
jgi:hypothetical protein